MHLSRRPWLIKLRLLTAPISAFGWMLLSACADSPPSSMDLDSMGHADLISLVSSASHRQLSLDEQLRLDGRLVEAITGQLPFEQRDDVRAALTLPEGTLYTALTPVNGDWSRVDPAIRPLFQALMELRASRYRILDRPEPRPAADEGHPRVILFLAEDFPGGPDTVAIVVRRPGDAGVPLIVLPESRFEPTDILLGVQIAVRLAQRQGKSVDREIRTVFHRSHRRVLDAQAAASVAPLARQLREAPVVSMPGVGRGRSYGLIARLKDAP